MIGRAGHHPLRRPAAAARPGPGAGPPAPAADPRRRHQRGRPAGRGRDPGRPAGRDAQPLRALVVAYRKATIALADEVVYLERRPGRRPRHARAAAGRGRPATPTRHRLRAQEAEARPRPTVGERLDSPDEVDDRRRGDGMSSLAGRRGDVGPPAHASAAACDCRPSSAAASAGTLALALIAMTGRIVGADRRPAGHRPRAAGRRRARRGRLVTVVDADGGCARRHHHSAPT